MVLFFIAATLFRDEEKVEKKVFNHHVKVKISEPMHEENIEVDKKDSKFRLLDKAY
jgi:hypothetical protein